MNGREVVIVGGGLAGISAALELTAAGADVSLVESRGWLGGRTFSLTRDGITIDNGQHVFLRCCTAYTGLLERLGVAARTTMQSRLHLPVLMPGGRRTALGASRFVPAPLHLAPRLLRYAGLRPTDRLMLGRALLPMRRLDPRDPALDEITLAEWLRRHGQSADAVERMWNLIALPTLNLPAEQASLGAAVKVFRTGLIDSSDAADVGVSAIPLAELHGAAASRRLRAAGVDVVTGARVTELAGGPTWVVRWADGERQANAVILAVTHAAAAALVAGTGAGRQPYAGLGHSPIVNVHMVLDRPVLREPFAAALDSPLQWLFDRTTTAGVTGGQCLAASLSAASAWIHRTREEIGRDAVTALRQLIPEARWARLEQLVVTREPRATFRAAPGSAGLRPGPMTGLDRLYLAGAWTATGWPDTMESAVRSGIAAARAVGAPPAQPRVEQAAAA